MAKYPFEKMKELPEEIFDNYYSTENSERYAKEVFPLLSAEQQEKMMDMIQDVYFRLLDPEAFLSGLKELVDDEAKYRKIAQKILAYDFLPIADYLEADILGLIASVGGDPNVYRWKVPARDVVAQILRRADLVLEDDPEDRLFMRLLKILESRVLNARNDEQTVQLLTGPTKTSGVGLDEAKARELLMFANEERIELSKKGVTIMNDEDFDREEEAEEVAETAVTGEGAEEVAAEEGVAEEGTEEGAEGMEEGVAGEEAVGEAPPTEEQVEEAVHEIISEPIRTEEPAPAPTAEVSLETMRPADVREIRKMEEVVAEKIDTGQAKTNGDPLEDMVEAAVTASGVKLDDEDLKRRFKNIVNLYFRDLRDSLETKSKLTMPTASGGMGLDDTGADQAMTVLEAKVREYRKLTVDRAAQAKERFVTQQAEQALKETELGVKKEKEARDKLYSKLTVKSGVPPATEAVAAPPASIEPPKPKFIPVKAADAGPTEEPVGLPTPSVKKPAAQGAATAPPPAKLPGAPLPPKAPLLAPPASAAKPAAAPALKAEIPSSPSGEAKKVVADVKFVPKLTGPVDELRSMTVKDFRRLSREPHEATLKLRDKIDLLEEQSFEMKTAGVKAWQDSEVNRLYLAMLRNSLEGKPILDVIAEKEAKNEPVLSKAEFDAIMELNRKLRFG